MKSPRKAMRDLFRSELKEQLESEDFNEELDSAIAAILNDRGSVTIVWPVAVSPSMVKLLRTIEEMGDSD